MKQITSLRGLAIILIILFHLNPEHFPYGYFGVEVFLVISGYLLMKSFQKQQMQIRLGEFARKKVLRLFTRLPSSFRLPSWPACSFWTTRTWRQPAPQADIR